MKKNSRMCRMAFFPPLSQAKFLTFLCLKILRVQSDFLEEGSLGEQDLVHYTIFASGVTVLSLSCDKSSK